MVSNTVQHYVRENGHSPFINWLDTLDVATMARVDVQINRMRQGNLGDVKSLKHGLFELRLQFGSGYRIYCAHGRENVVILLRVATKIHKGLILQKLDDI